MLEAALGWGGELRCWAASCPPFPPGARGIIQSGLASLQPWGGSARSSCARPRIPAGRGEEGRRKHCPKTTQVVLVHLAKGKGRPSRTPVTHRKDGWQTGFLFHPSPHPRTPPIAIEGKKGLRGRGRRSPPLRPRPSARRFLPRRPPLLAPPPLWSGLPPPPLRPPQSSTHSQPGGGATTGNSGSPPRAPRGTPSSKDHFPLREGPETIAPPA